MFERYRKTGNFIELGCNTGGVVLAAQDNGWNASGVDISVAATRYAREELSLDVFTGTLEEAGYPANHFDVVYSNSVMEHLAYPLQVLQEAYRILRPGGVFYADTVNWKSYTREILGANWRYIDPADHVHLYTPDNVASMAAHAGFEVERIWTTGVRVTANAAESTFVTPWYLLMIKGLLSIATRFTKKGDAIKFLLRKPH
jgi:SAM-dependent methyltransferase